MKNLRKLLELCQEEGGKIFVTDEKGDGAWVIMTTEEYRKIKTQESAVSMEELADRLSSLSSQAEELNRQITQTQIEDRDVAEEPMEDFRDLERENESDSETLYIEPLETE